VRLEGAGVELHQRPADAHPNTRKPTRALLAKTERVLPHGASLRRCPRQRLRVNNLISDESHSDAG